ncbi:unnamed protein product [Plutella xylostella]|uniref:(diamondback moth) hypothetical protein n=1 Tax=Plutella xylostella TaxID=51655 RepID=A0A8S4G241_PLUXY|nr:unnamed protein product [Plutella xylostella]
MEKSEDLIKDATPVLAPSPASTSNQQAELAAISVQSRLLPFWREIPRAWFLQFEAVVDPLKTSDDQKFRYVLQQLQPVDLQHVTDILYRRPRQENTRRLSKDCSPCMRNPR